MTLELWFAIGSALGAAGIGVMAFLFAAWASKRLDTLHTQYRQSAVVAESARSEVTNLHDALKSTTDALTEEQRSHRAEVAALRERLAASARRLAASATPKDIEAGLTRRPLPTLPTGSKTPGPVKK